MTTTEPISPLWTLGQTGSSELTPSLSKITMLIQCAGGFQLGLLKSKLKVRTLTEYNVIIISACEVVCENVREKDMWISGSRRDCSKIVKCVEITCYVSCICINDILLVSNASMINCPLLQTIVSPAHNWCMSLYDLKCTNERYVLCQWVWGSE